MLYRSPKGWFARNLLSYLLLGILLLAIVGLPVYNTIRSMYRASVMESAARSLSALSDTLDELCYEMDRTGYLTQSDGRMIPRLLQEDGYYRLQAYRDLQKICTTSSYVDSVALVYSTAQFQGEPMVYTDSGAWDARLYFEYAYRYDQWTLAEIRQQMEGYTKAFLRPSEWINVSGSRRAMYLTYVVPLSRAGRNMRGIMLFLIEQAEFDALVRRVNLPQEILLSVHDASDRFLYAQGDAQAEHAPNTRLSHVSAYNGWQYALFVPDAYINAAVFSGARNVLVYLSIALVAAIVLSMFITLHRAKPVRALTHTARRLLPGSEQAFQNEFAMISETLAHLEKNNLQLSHRLRSQRGMLREHRLRLLYEGNTGEMDALLAQLREEGTSLNGPSFRVLACVIDNAEAFATRYDASMRELIRFALVEAAQKAAESVGLQGVGCELGMEPSIALLVSGSGLTDGMALSIAAQLLAIAAQHFQCTLTIGISEPFDSPLLLSKAYQAALAETDRRFMTGEGCVYVVGTYPQEEDTSAALAPLEASLVDLLRREEYEVCHQVLLEYVDAVTRCATPAHARHAMSMLMLAMRHAIQQLRLPTRDAALARLSDLMSRHVETVTEQQEALSGLIDLMAQARQTLEASRNTRLVGDAMAYMEANLENPALNIDLLAGHLGVSSGNLSRTFKEQTQTTPMQFLDTLRMDKARALLRDTQMTIAALLEACGYVDKTNFIRKFRRLYGMTPMGYRSSEQSRMADAEDEKE